MYDTNMPHTHPRNPPSNGSGLDDRLADDRRLSRTFAFASGPPAKSERMKYVGINTFYVDQHTVS